MENAIVTGCTGTSRSSLPTLRAVRPRASSATGLGGRGGSHVGRALPLPIPDPAQDVSSVRPT